MGKGYNMWVLGVLGVLGCACAFQTSLVSPMEHPRVTTSMENAAQAGVAALESMGEVANAEYVDMLPGYSRVGWSLLCTASAHTNHDELVQAEFLTGVEWVANATTRRTPWNPHIAAPPLPALELHGPLVVHATDGAQLVLADTHTRVHAHNVTRVRLARPLGMRQLLGAPRAAGDAHAERGLSDVGVHADDVPLHVHVQAAAWAAAPASPSVWEAGSMGVAVPRGGGDAPAPALALDALLATVQRQLRAAHTHAAGRRVRGRRTVLRRVESVDVRGVPVYGMVVEVSGGEEAALWRMDVADVGEGAHRLLHAERVGAAPAGGTVTRDARIYANPHNTTRLVHANWPMYHTSAVPR